MIYIEITDELGTHKLRSNRDCVYQCDECRKETRVTKVNVNKPPICCKKTMRFKYWLDSLDERRG